MSDHPAYTATLRHLRALQAELDAVRAERDQLRLALVRAGLQVDALVGSDAPSLRDRHAL